MASMFVFCVCAVFTLHRSFYSTTSVHPVSVPILHPTERQILWTQAEREKPKTTAVNQGKASEVLAYLVRENNKTSQTRKTRRKKKECLIVAIEGTKKIDLESDFFGFRFSVKCEKQTK